MLVLDGLPWVDRSLQRSLSTFSLSRWYFVTPDSGTPPEGSHAQLEMEGEKGRQADRLTSTLALNNPQAIGACAPALRLAALGRVRAGCRVASGQRDAGRCCATRSPCLAHEQHEQLGQCRHVGTGSGYWSRHTHG